MGQVNRDEVYKFLISMELGQVVEISKLVKSKNRDEFVEILKDFIRFGDGAVLGFSIEFSSDFTTFRKIKPYGSI